MYEDLNIDELLNGYIDGELSPRHVTEVKRLVANDEDIAKRLDQLQKIKQLLAAIPPTDAPAEMLDDIKARLERRTLLGTEPEHFDRIKGVRHLLIRKTLSVAAMLVLIAILGAVLYSILSPVDSSDIANQQFAKTDSTKPKSQPRIAEQSPAVKTAAVEKSITEPAEIATAFSAVLELRTSNPAAVDAFVTRAIADNNLSKYAVVPFQTGSRQYTLSCPAKDVTPLLTDLQQLRPKLNSATLTVEAEEKAVIVNNVTVEQLNQIINQPDLEKNVQTAKIFAALNNMTELLPGRDLLEAAGQNQPDLITVPRPLLTSGEKMSKKQTIEAADTKNIYLTSIVTELKEKN